MKPKIPKGWRRLHRNEVIRAGDDFWNDQEKRFIPVWRSVGYTPSDGIQDGPYIRRNRRPTKGCSQ